MAVQYMLRLDTDQGVLACSNRSKAFTYEGVIYEPAPDRWSVAGELTAGTNLEPETLVFSLDAAAEDDPDSFVGRLLRRDWHFRDMRFFVLLLDPETGQEIGRFYDFFGFMDKGEVAGSNNAEKTLILSCEGSTYRVLERNPATVSDADQRRRNPDDDFFKNQALKSGQRVPFGTKNSDIPGYAGASSGGGSGGFNRVIGSAWL